MISLFIFIAVKFINFPDRKDALLYENKEENTLVVESSGSIGLHFDGKCQKTYPNSTLNSNERIDWCSNIAESDQKPWISYSYPQKSMRIRGYSVRNGCCWYACCCLDNNTDIYGCCCRLYSFSLVGSNDGKEWITIHKVEKEEKFWRCLSKTYEFQLTQPFKYIRFQMDEPFPNCHKCIQINELQLYGTFVDSQENQEISDNYEDESISIIGKVRRSSD